MSGYSYATRQLENGDVVDAFAADIAVTFSKIMRAEPDMYPLLEPLKLPLQRMLDQYGLSTDSREGEAGIARFIRIENKKDWESEYGDRIAYPGDSVIDNIDKSVERAYGFRLQKTEEISHFKNALKFMSYNSSEGSLWKTDKGGNTPFSALITALSRSAIKASPALITDLSVENDDDKPLPSTAAQAVLSAIVHGESFYKQEHRHFNTEMSKLGSLLTFETVHGARQLNVPGQDMLLYLYSKALSGDTDVVLPISGYYLQTASLPEPIKPIREYLNDTYKTSSRQPLLSHKAMGTIQTMIDTVCAHLKNPDVKLYNPEGAPIKDRNILLLQRIEEFQNTHVNSLAEALDFKKLSPNLSIVEAEEAYRLENDYSIRLRIVHEVPFDYYVSEMNSHDLIHSVKNDPGVYIFADKDIADAYCNHLSNLGVSHHITTRVECSPKQLRSIPVARSWQSSVLKRTIQNLPKDTVSQLSSDQRISLVQSIADSQGIHLPDAYVAAVEKEIKTFEHFDDWSNLVQHAATNLLRKSPDALKVSTNVVAPAVQPQVSEEPENVTLKSNRPSPM